MYNNGTSFSSPIMAGMAACLWQALPTWSSTSIMRAIELSGSQVSKPDSLLGYGIPDFVKALHQMNVNESPVEPAVNVHPNPFNQGFSISFYARNIQEFDIFLLNDLGVVVYSGHKKAERRGENQFSFPDLTHLPVGNYILRMIGNDLILNSKVIKINN